jgi:hypothetical protein
LKLGCSFLFFFLSLLGSIFGSFDAPAEATFCFVPVIFGFDDVGNLLRLVDLGLLDLAAEFNIFIFCKQ